MDDVYFCIVYMIFVILVAEYIYYYRYIPNLRRMADNGYRDF